jgi:hypothetical protein
VDERRRQRVAHVTLVISGGSDALSIARKLDAQAGHAARDGVPIDFFWFGGSAAPDASSYRHLRVVKMRSDNVFAIRAEQAKRTAALLDEYARVLLRYPLFDPALACFLRRRNRIVLEHHTKEVEELRLNGDARWMSEKLFGGRWISGFAGLTAVTQEIVEYEAKRSCYRGKIRCFPNTIDTCVYRDRQNVVRTAGDATLRLGMVASKFSPWQGLEKILDALEADASPRKWELHIAGRMPAALQKRIRRAGDNVHWHGLLPEGQLAAFYDHVHVGISCYDIESKGLQQATPLKVRDYLASGLPVILGYDDPGVPADFPYTCRLPTFDLAAVADFVDRISDVARSQIQHASKPYIDSKMVNQQLYEFCVNEC